MTVRQPRLDAPTVDHHPHQIVVTYRNRHDANMAACEHGHRGPWWRQMTTAIGHAWPDTKDTLDD